MKKLMMGTEAAAEAARLARVQVISAYPITPQTVIVETLSEMIGRGELAAQYLTVESEHSAMASCIGASATGARVFTATSSQGLAYMHEVLHYAAGGRFPVVMVNANRALTPPWNLYCDHTDSLSQRDTGWLQYYCLDAQDVLDGILIAYQVAERVLLPIMINLDAFYLTHTTEPIDVPSQAEVDEFLPPFRPDYKLDPEKPRTFGNVCSPELYTSIKFKRQQETLSAERVWAESAQDFARRFGRSHPPVAEYKTDDARVIIASMGTAAGAVNLAVDRLREKGVAAGGLRIAMYRPFPVERIRTATARAKDLIVIDRDASIGAEGILAQEIKSSLYDQGRELVITGFIAGIGGRDIDAELVSDLTGQVLAGRINEELAGSSRWVEVMK